MRVNIFDQISAIGGTLGLFTGVSLITFVEGKIHILHKHLRSWEGKGEGIIVIRKVPFLGCASNDMRFLPCKW